MNAQRWPIYKIEPRVPVRPFQTTFWWCLLFFMVVAMVIFSGLSAPFPLLVFPIGFAAGLVYAAVMGGLAELYTRLAVFHLLPVLLYAAFLVLVGAGIGWAYFAIMRVIPANSWVKITPAPQPVKSLESMQGGILYARTANGDLLATDCHLQKPCSWEQISALPQPQGNIPGAWVPVQTGLGKTFPTPPLLGRVSSSLNVRQTRSDGFSEAHYVLLADGRLLFWQHAELTVFTSLMRALSVAAGALIGPLVFLAVAWRLRDRESPMHAAPDPG
jgi:hypothetical protein